MIGISVTALMDINVMLVQVMVMVMVLVGIWGDIKYFVRIGPEI